MFDNLLPADQWALSQFGVAQLGDKRRNVRLVKIAQKLASTSSGTLPQAFPLWPDLKAAYRFLDGGGATFENIVQPHIEKTRDICRQPGEYLLIEDNTVLDYSSHRRTQNLGVIGNGSGRGFDLHSALALKVQGANAQGDIQAELVGLFDQQCRTPRPAPKGETRAQSMKRPRKSNMWSAGLKSAGAPPEGSRWIYIADRESDYYAPMNNCRLHGVDFIVRCAHDRRVAQSDEHLSEALAQAAALGRSTLELRARPGCPARTAVVEIRSLRVNFQGPRHLAALENTGVVEVREMAPPQGVEPLRWVLLTSLACATLQEALCVSGRYACRWWIEEYHKALKSGTGVEKSQLEMAHRLESLIAVLSVVAVRLLCTKFLARSRPQSNESAQNFGPQALELLELKVGKPEAGWTNQAVLTAIARMGGYIGRRSDGPPGWLTIWRGWQRLIWMLEAVDLISCAPKCG